MHSKKGLAVVLSKLRTFESPNAALEQYSTDSEVAASVLWQAYLNGDIEGKTVTDLGCGTGILGIGALALGAAHVKFVEVDTHAFAALMQNLALLEHELDEAFGNYEIIESDVLDAPSNGCEADTVVQNPPFGTRKSGADMLFLRVALELAQTVYSLHKTSTERYLTEKIGQMATLAGITRFSYPLKQTLPQHRRKVHRIEVSCLRITGGRAGAQGVE